MRFEDLVRLEKEKGTTIANTDAFFNGLTCEAGDTEYKYLKVLLDGQLEKKPENVLIYATSNRRHLIMETWSDRGSVGEGFGTLWYSYFIYDVRRHLKQSTKNIVEDN